MNFVKKIWSFKLRVLHKALAWSKLHKAWSAVIALAVVVVLIIVGFGVAVYGFGAKNDSTQAMAKVVPYPAVVVNGSWGLVRENNFIINYLHHFYDASKQSYDDTTLKDQVLEQIVSQQIVDQKAREFKVKVSGDEVNQSYQDLVNKNGQTEVNKVLKDLYGFTEADFKGLIKNELLKQKLEKQLRDNKQWREIQVKHLLVKVDASADQATADAARAKAQKYLDEIKAGKSFADEAKQYSEDTASKDNGGELGYISRGQMVKEFEAATFADGVKVGDILGPVRTQYGWHIIFVEDIHGDNDYVIWRNAAKVYKLI